ncbi:signal peptidase I [Auritidibacter ignavus]|uniref:signal peptidase I n=1 Tax=Auritidibacter ignavus TaxID=678932 RepID=UPI000F01B271|nr:signal peptidase I [Auritidibacter ignavus]NIH70909.1 signal peptidase I [Auritidibacter ignavus]RMX24077.1 signal peptidase I [Auritidibacter ignavus]
MSKLDKDVDLNQQSDDVAYQGDDRQDAPSLGRRIWANVREILIIVVAALVLSFIIKTFFFRAFVIPSGSMENTLQVNDRIFVNLMVPGVADLKRGDIVVFEDTQGWLPPVDDDSNVFETVFEGVGLLPNSSEQHLVKRIIGMPGDHVTVDVQTRKIQVNGEIIDEPYVYPGASGSDQDFDVTVPEGKLWVMGDHRNASGDSRAHQEGPNDGFVNVDDVVGRAEVIAWPIDRWGPAGSNDEPFNDVPEP